ncbi:hypothetical protein OIE68_45400 [Nocardia vinacea]|uniref:hypothetical protein n=1 Tax=Nocardia vinacea TaxID=96468 RepID=UPI002E0D3947|nr:hypothetical protein OIE68_45400 [Nocardia vinacea]
MSWPDPRRGTTDPAYYRDAADSTEARIRADFTRYYQLREIAPHGETPEQQQQFTADADALAARWGRHESVEHRTLWAQLQAAVAGWEARPESTRRAYDRITQARADGDLDVDAVVWRNLHQAAVITGHVETFTAGSDQDGVRWRPPEHTRGREADRASLLDRALGGRAPGLATLAEVDAIIAETDQLLEAEEAAGDLDNGRDERLARQNAALRQLQDATAEHTRLADAWPGSPERDLAHIARLESLLDDARTARSDAALAGVPVADIEAVYHAGRDGTYWDEQSAPLIGEAITGEPAPPEPSTDPGGAGIEEAIGAAMPEAEFGDWSPADGGEDTPTALMAGLDVDADMSR